MTSRQTYKVTQYTHNQVDTLNLAVTHTQPYGVTGE